MKEKTVVIGMSGGVDSSVAAYLLKEKGYNVIGATMQLLDNEETQFAIHDAKEIAKKIQIPHYVFDLRKEFKEQIIKEFIESYQKGLTPNPCINCNRIFKFGIFFQEAKKLGADYIATGHYAKVDNNHLMMSEIDGKDQSYFLCQIKKEIIPYILFPLKDYSSKEEIRQLARKYHLPVSEKKDSQEICFIPNDDYKNFLKQHNQQEKPGNIILKDGTVLGTHKGIYQYTIGQRKGLNISYKEPLYVLEINPKENTVIVGIDNELMQQKLEATNMNYLIPKENWKEEIIYAKIRSRGSLEEVEKIEEKENKLMVTFKNKIRAITPGQFIVFYNQKKECLGGAVIKK